MARSLGSLSPFLGKPFLLREDTVVETVVKGQVGLGQHVAFFQLGRLVDAAIEEPSPTMLGLGLVAIRGHGDDQT